MADLKNTEKELKEAIKKEKEALNEAYNDVIHKLKDERDRITKDIRGEYKQARKYVKKNPETGLGIALAGGLLVGFVLAKLFNR
jgi:ElaB/YqjD/DUF883 family membrane-anchored ribosome-binding protein